MTLPAIVEWLAQEHGIKVSAATVSRTLAKIRAAAPPPAPVVLAPAAPEPALNLAPATEEDELVALRSELRKDLNTADWRQRHSAAAMLLKLLQESRSRRASTTPPEEPTPQPSTGAVPFLPSFGLGSGSPTKPEA